MKRHYSVFNIVKSQKHAEMQKHYLLPKSAFHFVVMGYSFLRCTFFFIKDNFLPGNAFRHIRDFFRPKTYTIYNNTNIGQ